MYGKDLFIGKKYKIIVNEDKVNLPNNGTYYSRELPESNYQGVKRLFVLAYMMVLMQITELKSILIKSIFFQE